MPMRRKDQTDPQTHTHTRSAIHTDASDRSGLLLSMYVLEMCPRASCTHAPVCVPVCEGERPSTTFFFVLYSMARSSETAVSSSKKKESNALQINAARAHEVRPLRRQMLQRCEGACVGARWRGDAVPVQRCTQHVSSFCACSASPALRWRLLGGKLLLFSRWPLRIA